MEYPNMFQTKQHQNIPHNTVTMATKTKAKNKHPPKTEVKRQACWSSSYRKMSKMLIEIISVNK